MRTTKSAHAKYRSGRIATLKVITFIWQICITRYQSVAGYANNGVCQNKNVDETGCHT